MTPPIPFRTASGSPRSLDCAPVPPTVGYVSALIAHVPSPAESVPSLVVGDIKPDAICESKSTSDNNLSTSEISSASSHCFSPSLTNSVVTDPQTVLNKRKLSPSVSSVPKQAFVHESKANRVKRRKISPQEIREVSLPRSQLFTLLEMIYALHSQYVEQKQRTNASEGREEKIRKQMEDSEKTRRSEYKKMRDVCDVASLFRWLIVASCVFVLCTFQVPPKLTQFS